MEIFMGVRGTDGQALTTLCDVEDFPSGSDSETLSAWLDEALTSMKATVALLGLASSAPPAVVTGMIAILEKHRKEQMQ